MPSQYIKPISQFHFLFQFRENMGIALETIRTNKFRSFLTILGVVIGVTSVISVASIIQGLNNLVANRVSQLGSNVFFVSRLPAFTFGRLPERIRQRKYLKYEDALAIRERCHSVKEVTIFQTRFGGLGGTNLVRYGNEKIENVILRSAEPAYMRVLPIFTIRDGRPITENDNEHSSNVCVIGSGIAGTLFPVTDPVGKELNVNGTIFTIIGTFEQDPGLFGGPGIDQFVVIPYRTFHRMYPELKENIIAVSVLDPQLSAQAQGEVIEVLRRQRKIPANGENDFDLFESDILTTVWKQLTGAVVILTLVISSIGLLVGGIGVMNIMLVSVTERTREIGIRKAVGAQKKDIMQQFLMEAMTLTGAGGLIGILVGAVISVTIKTLIPSLPTQVSLLWVGIAFSVSVAVGLFFGIFPAKRAADLDPIVALRYE
jgi:putative ABC transport system permease protein